LGTIELGSAASRVQRPTKSPIKLASLAAISRLCLRLPQSEIVQKNSGAGKGAKNEAGHMAPVAFCPSNACGVSLKFHQRRKMKMEHNKLRSVSRNTPV